MRAGAHTFGYDYAFLSQNPCCRVGGGFFENGVGVEPFTKYVKLFVKYPHFSQK